MNPPSEAVLKTRRTQVLATFGETQWTSLRAYCSDVTGEADIWPYDGSAGYHSHRGNRVMHVVHNHRNGRILGQRAGRVHLFRVWREDVQGEAE